MPSDIAVAAGSGAAGVLSATFIARFFFERWVSKRESTEKDLHEALEALRTRMDLADDGYRAELEKSRVILLEEINRLRDSSHSLRGDLGVSVTRTAINAEMVVEIRNEMRAAIMRMDNFQKSISDEVGSLKTTIVRLGTILSERLPVSRSGSEVPRT